MYTSIVRAAYIELRDDMVVTILYKRRCIIGQNAIYVQLPL
jgi:hypothetical protein